MPAASAWPLAGAAQAVERREGAMSTTSSEPAGAWALLKRRRQELAVSQLAGLHVECIRPLAQGRRGVRDSGAWARSCAPELHRQVARQGERDGAVGREGSRCDSVLLPVRPVAVPAPVAAVIRDAVVIQAVVVTGLESAASAAPTVAVHRARCVAGWPLPLARSGGPCSANALWSFISAGRRRFRLSPCLGPAGPPSTIFRAGAVVSSNRGEGVQACQGPPRV